MTHIPHPEHALNPREAAFLALCIEEKTGTFIKKSLDLWSTTKKPSKKDFSFSLELATGTLRMQRFLDAVLLKLGLRPPRKQKEKILTRLVLYEKYFFTKVPLYATSAEAMSLAKKYCHKTFASFLYSVTQKPLIQYIPEDLASRFSHTDFFITSLEKQFSKSQIESILQSQNQPSQMTLRIRNGYEDKKASFTTTACVSSNPLIYAIEDPQLLIPYAHDPAFYIQNPTQPTLLYWLQTQTQFQPKNILDLCAAPGGKTILLHELFPKSSLIANDISKERLKIFSENMTKYTMDVSIICQPAEELHMEDRFDLIVIDAPCSNSGVLYKAAEARWRLEKTLISALNELQTNIIKNALSLLSDNGQIWYMTCSILEEENKLLIENIALEQNLKIKAFRTILPDGTYEGGFACLISK